MFIHLSTCISSAHTGRIFVKFDTGNVYVNISKNSKFGYLIEHTSMNVGPCHHGMALPQVADGGTASNMEGSCE
jgi:hypothetical protein